MYRPINLYEGDRLKDFHVVGSKYSNTHSQYASHYLVKCVNGPNKDRETWVTNDGLVEYLPNGKYYEAYKGNKQ